MMEEILQHEKPDWIINFAAESHVSRSAWGAGPFFKSNVIGTYTLLVLGMKHKINFLQISTDEVYGSIDQGEATEDSPLKPGNLYSVSKSSADLLCLAFQRTHGYPVWITRSANNYGPYQHVEKFIPLAISNLIEKHPIPLYGGGCHIRDWLHVEDNCSGIEVVRTQTSAPGIYNIGAQDYWNIYQVASMICDFFKLPPEHYIQSIPDRPGNDFRYGIDSSKLHICGWNPNFKFKEEIHNTIQWYIDHIGWWRQTKRSLEWQEYYHQIHLGAHT
jgi:dTDP-glucose 4,6-dehydratase